MSKTTTFKPGQSGNPAGRPSIAKALATNNTTTTEVLAKLAAKAMKWLDDPKHAEYAHQWLTNYTIGKPRDRVDVHMSGVSESDLQMLEAVRMTPYERRKALEAQDTSMAPDDVAVGD